MFSNILTKNLLYRNPYLGTLNSQQCLLEIINHFDILWIIQTWIHGPSIMYSLYSIMDVDLGYAVMYRPGGAKVEFNFQDTIHSTMRERMRKAAGRPIKQEEWPTVEKRTNVEVDRE